MPRIGTGENEESTVAYHSHRYWITMNTMNPCDDDIIIAADGISKTIGGNEIIHHLDLSLKKGRIYALLGPNGAGKTTTTRLLTGILHPDTGTVSVFGRELTKDNAYLFRRRMGMQVDGNSYEDMTVKDNIALWMNIYDRYDEHVLNDILHEFGLDGRKDDTVSRLSNGNRQKILIARALAVQPEILFLDEPTSGLDPESADALMKLLHESSTERGLTVFMCTHRLQGLSGIIDDVGFLENGRLITTGSVDELIREYWKHDLYALDAHGDIAAGIDGLADIVSGDDGHYTIMIHGSPSDTIRSLVDHGCNVNEFSRIRHDIHDLYFKVMTDTGEGE